MKTNRDGLVTLLLVLSIVAGIAFSQKSASDRADDNKALVATTYAQELEACYRENSERAAVNSLAASGEQQKQVLLQAIYKSIEEQKAKGIKPPQETLDFVKEFSAVTYKELDLRDCARLRIYLEGKLGAQLAPTPSQARGD